MRVRIIWQGKGFYKAVAEAKRLGGSYDPESKTWTVIEAKARTAFATIDPKYRGLEIVDELGPVAAASAHCPLYDPEQGCPLHGEGCASSRPA